MTSVLFVCLGIYLPFANGAGCDGASGPNGALLPFIVILQALELGMLATGQMIALSWPRGPTVLIYPGSEQGRYVLRIFDRFDHIIALDGSNREDICAIKPDICRAEVSLLLDYVEGREGQAVSDPYYGDQRDFDIAWDEVSAGTVGLSAALVKKP